MPPEDAAQRDEHADANRAFESEDDEHPLQGGVAAQDEADEADEEQAERLDAAVGATEDKPIQIQ